MVEGLPAIKKIITEYVEVLSQSGINVERVILYGSYARGNPRTDSDVDIVVISSDLSRFDFPQRLSELSKATLHIALPLEVIGYTPDEVRGKEGKSIFWDEICTTGEVIYEAA